MRRALAFLGIALGFALIVSLSVIVGFVGKREHGFDWELAAITLTGLGTLALAAATFVLGASTWQDVRASQRVAEAAVEANELVRTEQRRRPRLSIEIDEEKIHSRAEREEAVYVRLLARNERGVRAAAGTRVLVDHYERRSGELVTFGSPSLGWPSAADVSVTVFAGAARPFDLGIIGPADSQVVSAVVGTSAPRRPLWLMRIWLPQVQPEIADRREWVGSGTRIRLVVGSDDAEARFYDASVFWNHSAPDAAVVLSSLVVRLSEA